MAILSARSMHSVQAVELVILLLLLFVVAFGALARRLEIPYPIILVIAGALLGLVPGIPMVELNPDTIFFVVLPPLLYSSAWTTSWRAFRFNLVSILLLAFGLVFFTVIRSRSRRAMALRRFHLEHRHLTGRSRSANRRARCYLRCQTHWSAEADHGHSRRRESCQRCKWIACARIRHCHGCPE